MDGHVSVCVRASPCMRVRQVASLNKRDCEREHFFIFIFLYSSNKL